MTMTAAPTKRCTKCDKDLTGAKRLKDAKGQYWCPECGVSDATPTGSGLVSPCPKCHKPVHAASLVRDKKTGAYVCEDCAAGVKPKGGGAADPEAAKKTKMAIAGVVMIILGVVAYFWLNSL